jgi:hypothetical protein
VIKWQKISPRLWRGDNGMIITDESFSVGGVRIKFFAAFRNNGTRHQGDNFCSGDTLTEVKQKAVSEHA